MGQALNYPVKMHSIQAVVNIGCLIPSHVIVEHATALKQSCCDLMSGSRNCDSAQEAIEIKLKLSREFTLITLFHRTLFQFQYDNVLDGFKSRLK